MSKFSFCLLFFLLLPLSGSSQTDCQDEIMISTVFDCDESNCEFTYTWSFTGGSSNGVYNVSGTGLVNTTVLAGEELSVTYPDGTAVLLFVNDGLACESVFDSYGPIACILYTPCACNTEPGDNCIDAMGYNGILNDDCECITCNVFTNVEIIPHLPGLCEDTNIEFTYLFFIQGGLISPDSTVTYNISGTVDTTLVVDLNNFAPLTIGPLPDGQSVVLFISDENGCTDEVDVMGEIFITPGYCEELGLDCTDENNLPGQMDACCNCIQCDGDITITEESFICDEETCVFTFVWSVEGGLPCLFESYLGWSQGQYSILGTDINKGFIRNGESFSQTYETGTEVNFTVTDFDGTEANWSSNGPVNCNGGPCGCNSFPGDDCVDDEGFDGVLNDDCNCMLMDSIETNILVPASDMVVLFPNPAKEVLKVRSEISIKSVALIDLHGKLVLAENINSADLFELNIGELAEGIYLIRLEFEDRGLQYRKIVKR